MIKSWLLYVNQQIPLQIHILRSIVKCCKNLSLGFACKNFQVLFPLHNHGVASPYSELWYIQEEEEEEGGGEALERWEWTKPITLWRNKCTRLEFYFLLENIVSKWYIQENEQKFKQYEVTIYEGFSLSTYS